MSRLEQGAKIISGILRSGEDGVAYVPVKKLLSALSVPYGQGGGSAFNINPVIDGGSLLRTQAVPDTRSNMPEVLLRAAKNPRGVTDTKTRYGTSREDLTAIAQGVQSGDIGESQALEALSREQYQRAMDTALYDSIKQNYESGIAFADNPKKVSGVEEPIEINERYIVDGVRRAIYANDINPDMLVPVRITTKALTAADIPQPATSAEKLYAKYLMSGVGERSAEENRYLIRTQGLSKMLQSDNNNSTAWIDFRNRSQGTPSPQLANMMLDKLEDPQRLLRRQERRLRPRAASRGRMAGSMRRAAERKRLLPENTEEVLQSLGLTPRQAREAVERANKLSLIDLETATQAELDAEEALVLEQMRLSNKFRKGRKQ